MGYRAYHKETTRYLCLQPTTKTKKACFETEGAAKAAITREAKLGNIVAADFAVAEVSVFHDKIEKSETYTTLGNGSKPTAPFTVTVNTPNYCNPASESYWTM